MRKILCLLVLVVLLSVACDPGVEYNPSGWQRKGNYKFTNSYNGFDLELRGFQGLVGEKNYILEGEIYSREKTPIKFYVEKAVLKTNGREYTGEPNYRNENEVRMIKPNQSQRFSIYWDFNEQLYKVLKDPVELYLIVKSGERSNEISIPMTNYLKN